MSRSTRRKIIQLLVLLALSAFLLFHPPRAWAGPACSDCPDWGRGVGTSDCPWGSPCQGCWSSCTDDSCLPDSCPATCLFGTYDSCCSYDSNGQCVGCTHSWYSPCW